MQNISCCQSKRVAHIVAAASFIFDYVVLYSNIINKNVLSSSLNKSIFSFSLITNNKALKRRHVNILVTWRMKFFSRIKIYVYLCQK